MAPTIISLCIAGLSVFFCILTYIRNVGKDNDGIKESLLKANLKLDQVCATTNETRADIKGMDQRINVLNTEVEVIKRDLSTAFIKIDELKGEVRNEKL